MKTIYTAGLILLFLSNAILGSNIEITPTNGKYIIDESLQLIVCNSDITKLNDLANINSLTINLEGDIYEFNIIPNGLNYGEQYQIIFNSKSYKLYFSQLPLININTSQEIQDEPKVLANFILTDTTNSPPTISYCGIEFRGASSQSYSKKSFDIELWEDEIGDNTNKIPLLNMRTDDDWLLFAMYNEPLRVRNVINHKLWMKIHVPYYIDKEEDAKSGIRTQYVELAINNEYMGIYALCEQLDKKQLQLKKYKTTIRGELYKGVGWGASTFTALPPYDNNLRVWSGLELKYPKEEDITNWENIYNFVDFVINSSISDFEQYIGEKFVIGNAVDYFIFLNLLRATDNTGKNIFIANYKENEPYFYVPWDLDGSFGIIWNGEQDNTYNDILTNGFYNKLLISNNNIFNKIASDRWVELRNTILQKDSLINLISKTYSLLLTNGNYEREILKWGDESINLLNLEYTYKWLENRLAYLDDYFSLSILNVENISNSHDKYKVYPNPIVSTFRVNSSNKLSLYSIYNINGILLMRGVLQNDKLINIEDYSSGIYLLRILDNESNKFINIKILKQ
jgi:hypothetical protein